MNFITGFLTNNGVTCFAPPCFNWEIRSIEGNLIYTVSDIFFKSGNEIKNATSIELEHLNGLQIKGYVEDYSHKEIIANHSLQGKKLVITEII